MSKQEQPSGPGHPHQEPAPPSYSEATSASSSYPYTSHLAAHLSSLPSVIRDNRSAHHAHLAAYDADLLSLLTPEIDSLLSSLSEPLSHSHSSASSSWPGDISQPPPTKATLTLIPAAALSPEWRLSEEDVDAAQGIVSRVVRVRDDKGITKSFDSASKADGGMSQAGATDFTASSSSSSPTAAAREFDDEVSSSAGQDKWWWRDEDMAQRLAKHLQPGNHVQQRQTNLHETRQTAASRRLEKGSGSGGSGGVLQRLRMGSNSGPASGFDNGSRSPSPSTSASSLGRPHRADNGGVRMSVRAEEVSFRRENEMGIWESKSGWGIVVKVKLGNS